MPTYEYQCQAKNCQHTFTVVQSIAEHEKKNVSCPKCKKKRVRQIPSVFMANTSRKS